MNKIPKQLLIDFIEAIYDEEADRFPVDDFEKGPALSSLDQINARRAIAYAYMGVSTREEAGQWAREHLGERVMFLPLSILLDEMAAIVYAVNHNIKSPSDLRPV